jgi:hypothetical protein
MRTFVHKQKPSQEAKSASSARPGRAFSGQSREVSSILHLQRTIGNQAAQRLLQANAEEFKAGPATTASTRFEHDFSRIPLHANADTEAQPKLTIGTPGDICEQEADRAAEQVTHMPEPVVGNSAQREGSSGAIQRSNQPLSLQERAFFEPRFGHDFSRVRIHADPHSAEMADALHAEAFTVGNNIYFGPEKLKSKTRESDQLLAHELVHVTQQSRTGPALQPKLKITGKTGDVSRAITLLNSGLFSNQVLIDKSGNVSIGATPTSFRVGPPSVQEQALVNRLTTIINDPKDVIMTVSAGSKTLVGSYATGDIDIADIESIGFNALIHEIEEQYQKQVKGLGYGSETTGAHGEGIKVESQVLGAKRGAQKVISSTANPDGTFDAVAEVPYTFPDGKVKTMVLTIKSNNIESVTWK